MKNLTRKLFLSICTLAICAVTLVSTTFAWYTTSTEATANTVKGSSTNATADGSILVSATGQTGTWSNTCQPIVKYATSMNMVPLQNIKTDTVDTLKPLDVNQSAVNGAWLEFDIYFKTNANTGGVDDYISVIIKSMTLENAAGNLDANIQDNLLDGQNVEGAPSTPRYKVDIVRSLNMITNEKSTNEAPIRTHTDLGGFATSLLADEQGINDKDTNALNYYNHVMFDDEKDYISSSKIDGYEPADKVTSMNEVEVCRIDCTKVAEGVATYEEVCVTFRIYLDGWDNYCFDACKGQSFNVSFTFEGSASFDKE